MLSTLVLIGLLTLVSSGDSTPISSDNVDIFVVQLVSSSMGRVKYEDGEVVLYQNRLKPTDVFFTPFPRVDPVNSECKENILSGHVELSLSVDLYTPRLVQAIQVYLKRHFSTLCARNETCDVSLLPMNAIRLVQKGRWTDKARQMYGINDDWYSNTLLLQSIKFVLYMANQSVCEHLRLSIIEQCYLSNFELHYSLHSEKTVERQVEITSEQVTGTSMFNEIRSQFPRLDIVVLTGDDFKQLINEVIDRITMKLRTQEGFASQLLDPTSLHKLLERQLQFKQVQLEKVDDQLWDSLYWTRDLTRPDRLAKVINTIIRKNSTDTNHFIYDNKAAKNIYKLGLTQHDINRFKQLDKILTVYAHSPSSFNSQTSNSKDKSGINFKSFEIGGSGSSSRRSQSEQSNSVQTMTDSTDEKMQYINHLNLTNIESNNNTQYALSRADVENYLIELSDHVHLEDGLILPKPIDTHLIKLSELQTKAKLVSHTVLIRTRSNIHVLPLRCPPQENNKTDANTTSQYPWLTDKVEQLTNQLSEIKDNMLERIADVQKNITNRVLESERNCISKTENFTELENRIRNLEKTATKNAIHSNVDSAALPDILKWKSDVIIENDIRFDPSSCGSNLFISDNNTNLRKNVAHDGWYTCRIMNTGWTDGIHYWSIRVTDRGPHGHVMIGIVPATFSIGVSQHPGTPSDGYGFYLNNGQKYNGGQGTAFVSDLPRNNDTIGILLDLEARTLTYFKNGQILGTAFGQLPLQGTNTKYYPAVGLYSLGAWISLIKTTN